MESMETGNAEKGTGAGLLISEADSRRQALRALSLSNGQASRAPRRLVDRALRQMERGSVRVLGMVLNRVPERSSAYGSDYGGSYRYQSKSGGEDGKA